ncbi:MAG: glutamate formimidoyltransferase [Peptococcaceae bacterium]|nr:glutamate formimidoyltransferase [Peptococcaceae bacterium]
MKLVQCVPNFSEGRRPEVIAEILAAITTVPLVRLLDHKPDADHNRVVVTMVGEPAAVLEAAFQATAKARDLIDMEQHLGEHPRMGATDVIPFVPLGTTTMAECVALAEALGERIARELNIPVYLYERAARRPERQNLAEVRRGEYEGLKVDIVKPERQPDFGPARLHPTAGATVVGARPPLVAFNVNLDSSDVKVAKAIAKTVRESSGGLPAVKGLGLMLEATGRAQISMNMVDYNVTGLHVVFEAIKKEAAKHGVKVANSEVIGLLPAKALLDVARHYLALTDFSPEQVLELKLATPDES